MKKKVIGIIGLSALTLFAATTLWYHQAPHASSIVDTDIILLERQSASTNLYATMGDIKGYIGTNAVPGTVLSGSSPTFGTVTATSYGAINGSSATIGGPLVANSGTINGAFNATTITAGSGLGNISGTFFGDPSHLGIQSVPSYEGDIVATPPPIIFDCDIGTDIGDHSAAAMICAAHLMGLMKIEAMTCCMPAGWVSNGVYISSFVTTNSAGVPFVPTTGGTAISYVPGAGLLEQICMFYGIYPEFGFGNTTNYLNDGSGAFLPLGTATNSGAYNLLNLSCGIAVSNYFPLKHATAYTPAYKVMRTVLANRTAVTILTTGQLNDLADLLKSQADEISPLTGFQLVSNNVSRIVSMAGGYPNDYEYNIYTDATDADYVERHKPNNVPQIYVGYEIGTNILDLTPTWLSYMNHTNPIYQIFTNNAQWSGIGRFGWDSSASFYAMCNVKSNSIFSRTRGSNWVDTVTIGPQNRAGYNWFTPNQTGNDYYLTVNSGKYPVIEEQINAIGVSKPSPYIGMTITLTNMPTAGDAIRWDGTNRWYTAP